MKSPTLRASFVLTFGFMIGLTTRVALAAPVSDLVSAQKRQAVVRRAEDLTRVSRSAGTLTGMPDPFNPPNFDWMAPIPQDPKKINPNIPVPVPVAPKTDYDILESLANRLDAPGIMVRGGKTVLTVGRKQFEAGNLITVPDSGRDYVLEVAAITNSTFTLRYHNAEYTRPIHIAR